MTSNFHVKYPWPVGESFLSISQELKAVLGGLAKFRFSLYHLINGDRVVKIHPDARFIGLVMSWKNHQGVQALSVKHAPKISVRLVGELPDLNRITVKLSYFAHR